MKRNIIFFAGRLTKQDVHLVFYNLCDSDTRLSSTRKTRTVN